jgi:hypothetical protein
LLGLSTVHSKRLVACNASDSTLIGHPACTPSRSPVFEDRRARADTKEKLNVSALANEIATTNTNAVVIADGVDSVERAMSFQGMKGLNGMEERDLFVVVQHLHPAKYAELDVIGQWLEEPDVINLHYQDQINQATGRNTAFQQASKETKTVVVSTARLWNGVLLKLQGRSPRVQLYLDKGSRPW